jgi:hypothetical protein
MVIPGWLLELDQLEEKATTAPWIHLFDGETDSIRSGTEDGLRVAMFSLEGFSEGGMKEDPDFVCLIRNHAKELIAIAKESFQRSDSVGLVK